MLNDRQFDRFVKVVQDHSELNDCIYIDKILSALEEIEPIKSEYPTTDENKSIWCRIKRIGFPEYLKAYRDEEAKWEESPEAEENILEEWEYDYDDGYRYILVQTVRHQTGFRAVFIDRKVTMTYTPDQIKENYLPENYIKETVETLVAAIKESILALKQETYGTDIVKNIPHVRLSGIITRKDYWDAAGTDLQEETEISEETARNFIRTIPDEIETQQEYIIKGKSYITRTTAPEGRIQDMTAADFYRYTAVCYDACGYNRTPKKYNGETKLLNDKEMYYKYADGRDDDLAQVKEDSPEAFEEWLADRKSHIGHPWEIMRGGNSTHVSLFVHKDEKGYYLRLSGSSWTRCNETIQSFLALRAQGLPVILDDHQLLLQRCTGDELIGIVPEEILPRYCSSWFKQKIIDFINIERKDKKIIEKAQWEYPQMPTLNTVSFKNSLCQPNKKTIAALLEAERIAKDNNVKGHKNFDDLFEELDS